MICCNIKHTSLLARKTKPLDSTKPLCFAHLLIERLRAIGLKGTELAQATAGTIRLKLLKIAVVVEVSVRRVRIRLASACP